MTSRPFRNHTTPESLLSRSDSKDASRTCRGITVSGRRCRRDVAASLSLARTNIRPASTPNMKSLYCWQHKDQASSSDQATGGAAQALGRNTQPLNERVSEDTMLGRMADLNLGERPARKTKRPSPKPKHGFWASLCCIGVQDEDERLEIVRHRQRRQEMSQKADLEPRLHKTSTATNSLMKLIPAYTSPKTTSALLMELSKPLSANEEPGYIYIFILTDQATPKPREDDTLSLLNGQASHGRPQTGGEGLARSLSTRRAGEGKILLKIGRANNVHRRMIEWQRQCGLDITLLRFYPHVSTSILGAHPTPLPRARPSTARSPTSDMDLSRGIRTVPYSHRVERLVHLELAGQRARTGPCSTCGTAHREWFSVEASRRGVMGVDAVVKRWVAWAEGLDANT